MAGETDEWKRILLLRHWIESNIARLGNTCVEEEYYEEAARYYEEALSRNGQRGRRRRGGISVRSGYYGRLAEAYSGLGRDDEAVHAASGAVVAQMVRFRPSLLAR